MPLLVCFSTTLCKKGVMRASCGECCIRVGELVCEDDVCMRMSPCLRAYEPARERVSCVRVSIGVLLVVLKVACVCVCVYRVQLAFLFWYLCVCSLVSVLVCL